MACTAPYEKNIEKDVYSVYVFYLYLFWIELPDIHTISNAVWDIDLLNLIVDTQTISRIQWWPLLPQLIFVEIADLLVGESAMKLGPDSQFSLQILLLFSC